MPQPPASRNASWLPPHRGGPPFRDCIAAPDTRYSFQTMTAPREEDRIPMAMDAAEIERLIREALPDAKVEIRDLAGDGDHYAAVVISPSFRGKSRVQQHQMVYAALKGSMGGALHALALQTGTPAA